MKFNHAHCHVDAFIFAQVLDNKSLQQTSLDTLAQTLETYHGEFLLGDALPDVPEFEMWLLAQRSRLEQCAQRGIIRLVEGLIENGDLHTALVWAQRLLSLAPLLETAHAQQMWLYAKLGQRDAALVQYQHCRDLLQRELAVDPSDELQQLYQEILEGEVVSTHITQTTQAVLLQFEPKTTPFVGRETELAQLNQLWQSAKLSGIAIGLIHAEAGGGKSRLVREFIEQHTNALHLSGRCYESASRLPYQPWLDLLETCLAQTSDEILAHLAPVWHNPLSRLLPMLAVRLGSRQVEDSSSHNIEERVMFIAVFEFLLKLPRRPAISLFLDDLQWADEASLRLFQFVAHRARDLDSVPPVLLLGAYRIEETDDNSAFSGFVHDLHRTGAVMTLSLSPLDSAAVDSMIGQQDENGLPVGFASQQVRDTIHKMTKGNPLYVTELIQELRNMQELPETMPIPPSLEDMIQRRLRQLPDSGRQVIEAMAVVDMPINLRVAQRISGRSEDEVYQAIDIGLRWNLLKDETSEVRGVFNFSHDLMRETVRQQLNTLRHQRLHQRSAMVLSEINASAAKIAYHWREAGEVENELECVIRAGDEAMKLQSFQEARHFYRRAAEIVTDKRQRALVLVRLSEVLLKLSIFDVAETCYREAYDLATEFDDRELLADSQFGLGKVLQGNSQWQEARDWFEKCLKVYAEIRNHTKLAETHEAIGMTYFNEVEYSRAIACFEAQHQTGVNNDDLKAVGTAMTRLGAVYQRLNENETALNYFRDGLNTLRGHTDTLTEALLLGNMALVYYQLDEMVLAEKYFRQGLTISYDFDFMRGVANAANNLGSLNWMLGHADKAMAYTIYALGLSLDLKYQMRVTYTLANIALYLNELENFPLAEQARKKAYALMEQVNNPYSQSIVI
ncbi:MAG: tetratricopeptide repeat protein [Aggregatilineales bacterium]